MTVLPWTGFRDYFVQLTECEPARAAKFGLDHYTWLCINPKEAQDVVFAPGSDETYSRVH